MTESDNSTIPPRVTRRRMLIGTAMAIAASERKAFAGPDLEMDLSGDPAIAAWRKWQAAHQQTERLCRQQQRLERTLAEKVGFPCTTTRLRGGESVTLYSLEALTDVLDVTPAEAAVRGKAEADLFDHQARWDAADRAIGYSATLRAEREAADRAEDLLKLLSKTPAASLAGVAAKLDAVLREGQSSEADTEFPWPQIRSALDDIGRISRQGGLSQVFGPDVS
ncbi:hypothetical protein [Mesorhizobium sp. Cs1299R1N3]|uniref:hypothetical protein n=1 Tax=Mesorhizobium sp. Cs1299R1N3 TaxID=3015173 RepID=UPI00301E3D78